MTFIRAVFKSTRLYCLTMGHLDNEKGGTPGILFNLGIQLILVLQTMSPVLDGVMKFFSFLGKVEFYLLVIPFVYWVVNAQLGFRLLLVLISTDFLTMGFKQIFHQPRPYWIGNVKALSTEDLVWFSLQPRQRFAGCVGLPGLPLQKDLAVGDWGCGCWDYWPFTNVSGGAFPYGRPGGRLIGLVVIVIFAAGDRWASTRLERLRMADRSGSDLLFRS